MGLQPIIRKVTEFTPDQLPADMYGHQRCYQQFLYIDNIPVYKLKCISLSELNDKISELTNSDDRLHTIIPVSSFRLLQDTHTYDNIVVETLPGMSKYE